MTWFAMDVRRELMVAALSPLTRLTRLVLAFDRDRGDMAEGVTAFPWDAAICGLTNLQELSMDSLIERNLSCNDMYAGALPARLRQLTALRCLTVLGMKEHHPRNDSSQLRLAALPALESVALRLSTLSGQIPGLCQQQHVTVSRLVSLNLALRIDFYNGDFYEDQCLPAMSAPALTELILDDIKLAPDSEQLSWLPDLPKLRRLGLKDVKTASDQLPRGMIACSGLTGLVLKRCLVNFTNTDVPPLDRPECRLCSLPAEGPYLSKLVRLNLSKNAFREVPPTLASATALEVLNMAMQQLWNKYDDCYIPGGKLSVRLWHVQGLHVLDNLMRLRCVNLLGFEKSGAGMRLFRKAHPTVSVVSELDDWCTWWQWWRRHKIVRTT